MMRGGSAVDPIYSMTKLPNNYIDINDVIELYRIQDGKCYICNENMLFEYKPYCKNQFTLDRINNENLHLKGNVLIACYYCNCNRATWGGKLSRTCKHKCCKSKSNDIKCTPSKDIINKFLSQYNKNTDGDYSPNDNWIDYITQYTCSTTEDGIKYSFYTKQASNHWFKNYDFQGATELQMEQGQQSSKWSRGSRAPNGVTIMNVVMVVVKVT